MKKLGIYKLTSPSGKSYIGQSVNLDKRINQYKSLNCKKQPAIYNAILKYGIDNFKIDILWSTEDDTNIYFILNQLEKDFISLYDCVTNGYNIKTGGDNKGTKHTDETKEKLRIAANKQFETQEARDKVGFKKIGVPLTEEHKKKCSDALKGRIFSDEHKLNLSKAGIGRKMSQESIEKSRKAKEKAIIQYDILGNFMAEFESASKAAIILGVSRSKITDRLAGKIKNIKDYNFKYKE